MLNGLRKLFRSLKIPQMINLKAFKLMDQDDDGSINKSELIATCGGDYQMYEKMNGSGEGVPFEAFEAFGFLRPLGPLRVLMELDR